MVHNMPSKRRVKSTVVAAFPDRTPCLHSLLLSGGASDAHHRGVPLAYQSYLDGYTGACDSTNIVQPTSPDLPDILEPTRSFEHYLILKHTSAPYLCEPEKVETTPGSSSELHAQPSHTWANRKFNIPATQRTRQKELGSESINTVALEDISRLAQATPTTFAPQHARQHSSLPAVHLMSRHDHA